MLLQSIWGCAELSLPFLTPRVLTACTKEDGRGVSSHRRTSSHVPSNMQAGLRLDLAGTDKMQASDMDV